MILHLLPRTRRIKNCAVGAANSRKCLLNNLSENRALIFFLSGSVVCCTVKVQKAFGKDAGEAENRPRGVAILLFLRERKKAGKKLLKKNIKHTETSFDSEEASEKQRKERNDCTQNELLFGALLWSAVAVQY